MKRRIRIGETYSNLSGIILGFARANTWGKSKSEMSRFISQACDLGITSFDHADIYGDYQSEENFGKAFLESRIPRNQIQLITKCGIRLKSSKRPENKSHIYDTSLKHIKRSVEQSLKSLNTSYIDIVLIHRPDPLMNADEVANAFTELRQEGKVLYFGVSNFNRAQIDLLQSRLDFKLVSNQVEISPIQIRSFYDGTLDYCQQHKLIPMAWAPLAAGELFCSTYQKAFHVRDELEKIGKELGDYSFDQVALAWLMQHPSRITPVIGTGNMKHLENSSKADCILLTREQWFRIYTIALGHDIP